MKISESYCDFLLFLVFAIVLIISENVFLFSGLHLFSQDWCFCLFILIFMFYIVGCYQGCGDPWLSVHISK